jgi:glyoxylase-like metal-dependent hydrolase (beta-lactamase superfamily II)
MLKIRDKRVVVINTHHHWDHIWGNHMFQGNQIISHSLCRDLIDQKWEEMIKTKGKYIMGVTKPCLPTMTFEQEIYFPEDHIRLFYSPGHTIDSISVVDEEDNIINIGDNIGDDMTEIMPSLATKKEDYISTLRNYIDLNVKYYVSGHNIVVDKTVILRLFDIALDK